MRAPSGLVLLILLATLPIGALSQGPVSDLPFVGKPLAEVLDTYRASGLKILYSTDLVKPWMTVRTEPSGANDREILSLMLADHGLTLERRRNTWLIVRAPPEDRTPPYAAISGIVRGPSGGGLAGATVRMVGKGAGVTTGEQGDFWLTEVAPGTHGLIVEAPGHETARTVAFEVAAGETAFRNIRLARKPAEIENVIVHASRYELRDRQQSSYSVLLREDLENLPVIGREPLRALARLPGTASNGLSARTNIRGGEEDEVLVVFDGLTLYEPYHLKDFQAVFSALDSRVVENLEVFTGGFPVQYGDRLSGVVDITSIRPPDSRHHEISVDLFNIGALTSGISDSGRGEWLASARVGTLDLFLDIVNSSIGDPSYSDLFGQYRFALSDNMQLTTSLMHANDRIRLSDADEEDTEFADADYRTTHAWAALTHNLSNEVSYRTLLAFVDVDNDRRGELFRPDEVIGSVTDGRQYTIAQLKQDWVYAPTDTFRSLWGFDLRRVDGKYDYASTRQFVDFFADLAGSGELVTRNIRARPDGGQLGFYVSNRWRMTEKLTGELGLRWDRQSYTISGGDEQTSPRASILFEPNARTALRAGWGRFYQAQGIHELQVEDGVSSFFPAQLSEHVVLGVSHSFPGDVNLRFELYNKQMDTLRPRFENLFSPLELLPELEPDRAMIAPDSATARGAEVLVSRDRPDDPLSWWFSASWAAVEDRIDGVDVPRSWDQRRAFGAGFDWEHGKWTVALAARLRSGWPTTDVSLVEEAQPGGGTELVPVIGERSRARFSGFQSFDVRASRREELANGRAWTFFVELNNFTNHDNACCVSYSLDGNGATLEETFDNWLGIVPSVGVVWEF